MNVNDVIKKVKRIEITSLRKANALFLGEYHSSFKGRGMIFSEVRPYQYGDDVRKIDWNKTARFQEPYIKIFEEERELSLMLIVDISASMNFGTRLQTKRETIAEICATLGFSALKNNDKVGLILFSDKINVYLPPKKGKSHLLRIIREIIQTEPIKTKTDNNIALEFTLKMLKRKSIVFLFSDFDTQEKYDRNLQILAQKHDCTGVRMYDEKEAEFPDVGWLKIQDLETQKTRWINTSSKKTRLKHQKYYQEIKEKTQQIFKKSNAGLLELQPQQDYCKELMYYFKSHIKK